MDDVITRFIDLPTTIGGYTLRNQDGDYNIVINSRMSREKQLETYRHELDHIQNGDFHSTKTADLIEIHAHASKEVVT